VIIDAHCHAGTGGNRITGPWDVTAPLDRYLRRARAAGIGRTILIPIFHTDYRVANRELARLAASNPERFWFYAMVHPRRDAGRIQSMVGEARDAGARGIKVHRHDAPITREVCEAARRWSLPILYDVMGEASAIELVAADFPDLRVIVPHLGSFGDDWRAHLAVIDQLARHPNVYADTSGVRRFDYLVEAVRRAGPDKLIFGSDGPWLHPGLELHKIRVLGLPASVEAQVTGGTIARLLSSPPVPQMPRPAASVTRDATAAPVA